MKALVIVPTYNERENLPQLVPAILGQGEQFHLLVVDDNSPDGTGEVADKLATVSPDSVSVLHRTEKDGLGRAYVAGMTRALEDGADGSGLSRSSGRISDSPLRGRDALTS